jgi:cyclophilin family peptidyl-prolyl cis-trans isomerase
MRMKMLFAGAVALCLSTAAFGQTARRPTPVPEPSVPAIRNLPPRAPDISPVIPALIPENTWVIDLSNGGRVAIQLRPDQAPNHVERVKTLTRQGFYNGIIFHRVIEGFMAQGGDPTGTGRGDSGLPDLQAEFNRLPHVRGAVAMARTSDPNSANSQFYIMFVPRLAMDGDYTVIGRVVSGMNFVDQIQRGEPPAAPTRIVRASMGSDNTPPPTAEEIAAANSAPATPPAADGLRVLNVPSLTGGSAPQGGQPAPTTPPSGATPTPQR